MRFSLRAIRVALPLAVAAILGLASNAGAQITNPSFETGDYTGWNTSGNASIETYTSVGEQPTDGTYQAMLQTTNASTGGGTGNTPTSAAGLDTFLGLSGGTLEGGSYKNGSAINQTFTANAGQSLRFDANFLTNEANDGSGNPDQAYAYLLKGSTVVDQISIGTPTQATQPLSFLDTYWQVGMTGYSTFTINGSFFTSTGSYTLEFAVLNSTTTTIDSGLLVDNIQLNTPSAVPLPAGVWAGLLGMSVSLGAAYKMRRRMYIAA
jgi:hypothetical protein